jgi:hypothetical protein
MEKTDYMKLIGFDTKLILVLAHKELDKRILAYNQALSLLLLVESWSQEWHHVLGKCSQFPGWRKLFHDLGQDFIYFLQ